MACKLLLMELFVLDRRLVLRVERRGEEEYDGLGDALAEEGDDFNDDTFGIGGEDDEPVGQ
jgi:hypothetical protein